MFYKADIEWPSKIAQQALQPCAIVRGDAHRGIQRELATSELFASLGRHRVLMIPTRKW
jgi:hypothetical protein